MHKNRSPVHMSMCTRMYICIGVCVFWRTSNFNVGNILRLASFRQCTLTRGKGENCFRKCLSYPSSLFLSPSVLHRTRTKIKEPKNILSFSPSLPLPLCISLPHTHFPSRMEKQRLDAGWEVSVKREFFSHVLLLLLYYCYWGGTEEGMKEGEFRWKFTCFFQENSLPPLSLRSRPNFVKWSYMKCFHLMDYWPFHWKMYFF